MRELLTTLVIFPLAGFGFAALLRLPQIESRVARIALHFVLGAGANGFILFAAGAAGVPLSWPVFLLVPFGGLIALLWRGFGRRKREATDDGGRERTPLHRHAVAAALFAVPLLLLLLAAAYVPVRDYDGRTTWLPKAKAIVLERSIAGPFFQGQRGLNLHNQYPLLMPLDAATVMSVSRNTTGETARWLFVAMAVAMLVALRFVLVRSFGSTGAWVAAAVAWLPLFTAIEGGALSAYSDLPIAAFACAALLFLTGDEWGLAAVRGAAWCASFAILTKNEGTLLALAIVAAAILVARRMSLRFWAELLLPPIAAMALLGYWHSLVPDAYDHRYASLLAAVAAPFARILAAVSALIRHAADFSSWGGFWIFVGGAVVVALVRGRWRALRVPLAMLCVMLAVDLAAFTVTSWDVNELAKVAASRLLAQLIAPAAFVIALGIESLRPSP